MRIRYSFYLVLLIFVSACVEKQQDTTSPLPYFLTNPAAIIKINHLDAFKSELKNNSIITAFDDCQIYAHIQEKMKGLHYLDSPTELTLAFYEQGKANFEFLALVDDFTLVPTQNISDLSQEDFTYEGTTISRYAFNTTAIFVHDVKGKVLISSSKMLLENTIRTAYKNQHPKALEKLMSTANPNKTAIVFINLKDGKTVFTNLIEQDENQIARFADWMALDINPNQNTILLSGVTLANDSLTNYLNLFKGTTPQQHTSFKYAPQNSSSVLSFNFGDYATFAANKNRFLDVIKTPDTIFNTIEEVGLIALDQKKAVVLNSYGADNLTAYILENQVANEAYQGKEIYQINAKNILVEHFKPLVSNVESNYVCFMDNALLFAKDKETLKTIIANVKLGTTFDKTTTYKSVQSNLPSESSIFFVANQKGISNPFPLGFTDTFAKDVENIDFSEHAFAGQWVVDTGFLHTNLLISKSEKETMDLGVNTLFTLELDSDLATNPQFVKNHRNNTFEILVQDIDHNLYLISPKGKVIWKKQLDGPIRGSVHQVDIYKNGRLQLAFCTNNQFLVLDRNGTVVAPFQMSYEGGNLNELAVFDYENTRDYRFVVTQGNKTFIYNNRGAIVDGYTFKEASHGIVRAPQHFRIAKKDYLVYLLDNNTITIRHRAGRERIKVDASIPFSNNPLFLYKNKFSITDTKGVLHQIDTKGNITKTNFNLNDDHGMYATSKTLVLMDENTISIKGKKVVLELGVYTKPKIFYIKDKIYVTVTDIQNQQIYLFDSQAKPIKNFPIYGNSLIDMMDMDGDNKLELVAKDQDNSIITYRMEY